MKAGLPFVLFILTGFIPVYSQLRPDPKQDVPAGQFLEKKNKTYGDFGKYKFDAPFDWSWRKRTPDSLPLVLGETGRPPMIAETYQGEPMPCYKPAGLFTMKVYSTDRGLPDNMPIKRFVTPRSSPGFE